LLLLTNILSIRLQAAECQLHTGIQSGEKLLRGEVAFKKFDKTKFSAQLRGKCYSLEKQDEECEKLCRRAFDHECEMLSR
jgi:hypothetical protein